MAAAQPATPLSSAAVQALMAQILEGLGKTGMAEQDVVKVGQAFSAAIPTPEVTPKEQQDAEKQWADRYTNAHKKLRNWQQQLVERREAERKAKRQRESAEAHVKYWENTLAAATCKDPNWENREKS